MDTSPTPEELAEALVVAGPGHPGGGWCIHLVPPGGDPPVLLAPHVNPAVVRGEAEGVRRFVAAVIRQAREASATTDPTPPRGPGDSTNGSETG